MSQQATQPLMLLATLVPLAAGALALVIWLVVVPLGLRGVFEALGVDRSRAWIPFVNVATVYRLGGYSEFWLIALVIPVADVVGVIVLFIATHRINRRLGRSGWYTVLAVVAWWVWTLALGLQRRVDRTAAAEPLVWSTQRRPQTSLAIPPDDDSTPPAAGFDASTAGFIAPMPGQVPAQVPVPAPVQTDAAVDSALLAFAPPVLAPPAPAPAPALAPPVEEHEARLETPPPAHDDDDATILTAGRADATVVSARLRPRWWVQTAMGSRVELTGAAAILGRRPAGHPLYPGAQLIAVTDDALSVSATHAVLEFVDGEWQVTDLDSTNGVWLLDDVGDETELGARNRARVTPRFMLGELGVQVVQGG